MKFRVGDKVRIIKKDCSGCRVGEACTLMKTRGGALFAWGGRPRDWRDGRGCSCKGNWKLIKRGGVHMKAPKFVLLYILDEDPHEVFHTRKAAEKRIGELVEAGAEDIVLITAAKVEEVVTPSRFELKELKT